MASTASSNSRDVAPRVDAPVQLKRADCDRPGDVWVQLAASGIPVAVDGSDRSASTDAPGTTGGEARCDGAPGIDASCPNPTANPVGSGSAQPPEGACADESIHNRSPLVSPIDRWSYNPARGVHRQRGAGAAAPGPGRRARP